MILADEVEKALHLINNPPAYYKDHENQPLKEIKTKLLKQVFDTKAYIDCERPIPKDRILSDISGALKYPRFDIIADEIKKLNYHGKVPWIYEYAPGTAWEAVNFERMGLKFKYKAHTLSQVMEHNFRENYFKDIWQEKPDDGQPTIFIACEIIEHLHDHREIEHVLLRTGVTFDQIFISTPKYTWAGGLDSWEDNFLGHLRTYTPTEFMRICMQMFPNYQATYYEFHCMLYSGKRVK